MCCLSGRVSKISLARIGVSDFYAERESVGLFALFIYSTYFDSQLLCFWAMLHRSKGLSKGSQ